MINKNQAVRGSELVTVKATVEKVNFYNGGSWAAITAVDEHGVRFGAAGSMVNPAAGMPVELFGCWSMDPKWGLQFKIERSAMKVALTRDGIVSYLASGFINGVGIVKANAIYTLFGMKTLDVIENHHMQLTKVTGITPRIANAIHEGHKNHHAYIDLIQMLKPDITDHQIELIYAKYGTNAIGVLKNDPYILIKDIDGVGFKKADRIARACGISEGSPKRVNAAIVFCLKSASDEGHCYTYADSLEENVKTLLGKVDINVMAREIKRLVNDKLLTVEPDGAIYLTSLYKAETGVCKCINDLLAVPPKAPVLASDIKEAWEQLYRESGIEAEKLQYQAVTVSFESSISVITGGPGTGKTTIIQAILRSWAQRNSMRDVLMMAPTGKAARRMSEVTEHAAHTIHRGLDYTQSKGACGFRYHEKNKLPFKLIIIDEASMLDVQLAHSVLQAVRQGARVILLGDIDQLPAIGPGNFFRDLVRCYRIPTTKLTLSYRQHGKIALNASLINQGKGVHAFSLDDSFSFVSSTKENIQGLAVDSFLELVKKFGVRESVILAPMKQKSTTAVNELNRIIQQKLNPPEPIKGEMKIGERFLRVGDRVLQTKNLWKEQLSNGDVGTIVSAGSQHVEVRFDNGIAYTYDKTSAMSYLILAYAITIHKSQGSEYKSSVVLLNSEHAFMATRNLLYTAVTRAKEKVVLISDQRSVAIAVGKVTPITRNTKLYNRLCE